MEPGYRFHRSSDNLGQFFSPGHRVTSVNRCMTGYEHIKWILHNRTITQRRRVCYIEEHCGVVDKLN